MPSMDAMAPDNSRQSPVSEGKVLIVDDEEYVRGVLLDMLDVLGFKSLAAADGDRGLAAFENARGSDNPEDTIIACIVDLTMPGMPGMELLARIREIDAEVPILLVSGYSRHEVRQQQAKNPNIGFLQKPFTLDQFRDVFSTHVEMP